MSLPIEDYALISDTQSAALLGSEEHGRWLLTPAGGVRRVRRRYRPGTLILETNFETDTGPLRVIDCMPPRGHEPDLVREALCIKGYVPFLESNWERPDEGIWEVSWAVWTRPAPSSSGCSPCATTWACSPRNRTHARSASWATFPQAFSHVALINTAQNLTHPSCPVVERSRA